jgi:hypothetical protein
MGSWTGRALAVMGAALAAATRELKLPPDAPAPSPAPEGRSGEPVAW